MGEAKIWDAHYIDLGSPDVQRELKRLSREAQGFSPLRGPKGGLAHYLPLEGLTRRRLSRKERARLILIGVIGHLVGFLQQDPEGIWKLWERHNWDGIFKVLLSVFLPLFTGPRDTSAGERMAEAILFFRLGFNLYRCAYGEHFFFAPARSRPPKYCVLHRARANRDRVRRHRERARKRKQPQRREVKE